MIRTFRYKMDKRCKRLTAITIFVATVIVGLFIYRFFNIGFYIPAWIMSFLIAITGLYILSIPRYIKVGVDHLEIHCILELTRIAIDDIDSIRRIDHRKTGMFLLLGSYGFFGYFGYYFNLKKWDVIKVYASQWNNFVEIKDIYEQKFIVSCQDPDTFIASVEQTISDRNIPTNTSLSDSISK